MKRSAVPTLPPWNWGCILVLAADLTFVAAVILIIDKVFG